MRNAINYNCKMSSWKANICDRSLCFQFIWMEFYLFATLLSFIFLLYAYMIIILAWNGANLRLDMRIWMMFGFGGIIVEAANANVEAKTYEKRHFQHKRTDDKATYCNVLIIIFRFHSSHYGGGGTGSDRPQIVAAGVKNVRMCQLMEICAAE